MKLYKTPCIGICTTVYGDTICGGCNRFENEVSQWVLLTEEEQSSIITRIDNQLTDSITRYFSIINEQLLRERCRHYKIRIDENRQPSYWLYKLLHDASTKIRITSKYGFNVMPEFESKKLSQTFELWKTELQQYAQRSYFNRESPIQF